MKLHNEFTVNTPIDRAWALLTDLEGIAPCMPGAQLTGVDGDVYKGKVKVKVGPVISEFAGTAQFAGKDDTAYRAVIDAKGRDARSAGNAAALVTAQLTPDGDKTQVSVDTDLKISGKLAQFGAGMIKEVSGKLLTQFVANLETKLAAEETGPAVTAPAVTAPAVATSGAGPGEPAATTASTAAIVTAPDTAAVEPSPVEPSTVLTPAESSASTPATFTPPASESATSASSAPAGATTSAPDRAAFTPPAEEAEALDLLSLAGGSIYKRLIPVAVGVVAAGAVVAWLIARRR